MHQIQTRDLSANDYDLLLKLDDPRTKSNNKDISKWNFWDNLETEEQKESGLSELNRKE